MHHNIDMTVRRWVLFSTVVVVGGMSVAVVFISSSVAGQAEAAVSAIAAVAAIGTGVWAALPHGNETHGSADVAVAARTGMATADGPGSRANSGVLGAGTAKRTGTASATAGGSANTGVDSEGAR
jgi:hypothetical protein